MKGLMYLCNVSAQKEAVAPVGRLRLNFRGASIKAVLDFISDAAQLHIHAEPTVDLNHAIDLWHEESVDVEHAIHLLKQALLAPGYAVIRKGPILSIKPSRDAKKEYIALPAVTCTAIAA
jgi:type II secretory pathway component GspD/PulD (secretin)